MRRETELSRMRLLNEQVQEGKYDLNLLGQPWTWRERRAFDEERVEVKVNENRLRGRTVGRESRYRKSRAKYTEWTGDYDSPDLKWRR